MAFCCKIFLQFNLSQNLICSLSVQGRQPKKYFIDMDTYGRFQIDDDTLASIAEEAKDWANTHGLVMKNARNSTLNNYAPFMLFPSPFPKKLFKQAVDVQSDVQTLLHKASQDSEFINHALKR